jgi:signal recognition particle receptor subunit beta
MVLFNHATREMTAKIVYYGPGLCGKTTNLMVIFDKLDPSQKGKMLSLATKTDRTLFFDLLPVDIGKVGAFNLKIQLYTVPGQVFYNETRKLVLRGADSVVFVADSQPRMIEANRESFANLLENLEENQLDPNDIPIIVQYNKRDVPGVLPVETLQDQLGFEGYPYTEASAVKGEGVMETFRLASKITAKHLLARLKSGSTDRGVKPKPAAKVEVKSQPEPETEPASELEAEPLAAAPVSYEAEAVNPFADSVPFDASAVPFPEAENPLDAGYEKMEEVSLDQLVSEGRERPATMSGNIPIPLPLEELDEIEELGAESLVPAAHEVEQAVAVIDEPPPEPAPASAASAMQAELEGEVAALQQQLRSVREQHRAELESLLGTVEALAATLRAKLEP